MYKGKDENFSTWLSNRILIKEIDCHIFRVLSTETEGNVKCQTGDSVVYVQTAAAG